MFFDVTRWFRDPDVARALLRILSKAPYMDEREDLSGLLTGILDPIKGKLPIPLEALRMAQFSSYAGVAALNIGLRVFSKRFITGEGEGSLLEAIWKITRKGFDVNCDVLGEETRTPEEEAYYSHAYHSLIDLLSRTYPEKPVSISLKLSSFYSHIYPEFPTHAIDVLSERVAPHLEQVKRTSGHVFLDAEEYSFRKINFAVWSELYRQYGSAARFVLQAYFRDADAMLDDLIAVNDPNDPIIFRLVKGAYWETEYYTAQELRRPIPIFTDKRLTDHHFIQLFSRAAKAGLRPIPGTQNMETLAEVAELGVPFIEAQYIRGLGERAALAMARRGYPGRFYVATQYPGGSLRAALPFVMRRAVELGAPDSCHALQTGAFLKQSLKRLRNIPEWKGAPR